MAVDLVGPVGLRGRRENVLNLGGDQGAVIDLLSAIGLSNGGREEPWSKGSDPWLGRPVPGDDGDCPAALADAIWVFQDHWRARGVFRAIDGVVDPGGNTLKKMNELTDEARGQARVLVGYDAIVRAYPDAAYLPKATQSIFVEMTHFDIGGDTLKPAHKDAIFTAMLKAADKDFRRVQGWGFHSRTGGPKFDNMALALRRAENAIGFARMTGAIDARIREWSYSAVAWRVGMPPGESPLMRKVVLLFLDIDPWDARTPLVTLQRGQRKSF
jgi:hypothetical protein